MPRRHKQLHQCAALLLLQRSRHATAATRDSLCTMQLTTEVLMPPKSRAAAYSDSSVMVAAVSATSASLSSRVAGMSSTCSAHHYAIVLFHKLRGRCCATCWSALEQVRVACGIDDCRHPPSRRPCRSWWRRRLRRARTGEAIRAWPASPGTQGPYGHPQRWHPPKTLM
jgi:hypothetical protein